MSRVCVCHAAGVSACAERGPACVLSVLWGAVGGVGGGGGGGAVESIAGVHPYCALTEVEAGRYAATRQALTQHATSRYIMVQHWLRSLARHSSVYYEGLACWAFPCFFCLTLRFVCC